MTKPTALPPDRIVTSRAERRDAVLDLIREAHSRITLSLFRCTDKAMFDELTAAVDRGVKVEVMVTSRAKGGKKKLRKLWHRLEGTGASVCAYTDPVVKYHAKYMVVDDGPALITSLNFTRKCFETTCDALAFTWDPDVVAGLRALMESDRHCGVAPDSLPERLINGPERARRLFRGLIERARSSISIIDAKLSDPALITLLNKKRDAGVKVEIFSTKDLHGMKSHGKMMLVDGRQAVVGSLALTALSLDFRREVALVVEEPSAVAEIEALFRSIGGGMDQAAATPQATAGGA
jgi:phosphatidylserine/phosphatidylglycerophosphate/cardiolipin synthase-like enzyme